MIGKCVKSTGEGRAPLRLALHRRVGKRSGTRGSLKHFEDWGSSWGWVCGNRGLCRYRDGDQKKGKCNTQVETELAGLGCRGSRHWTPVLSVTSELWKGGRGSYLPSGVEPKSWLLVIWGERKMLTVGP